MDAKKKTKIWIIVFLSTLGVAGILATLIGQKTQLFKGFFATNNLTGIPADTIQEAICEAQTTIINCTVASGCTWRPASFWSGSGGSCSATPATEATEQIADLTVPLATLNVSPSPSTAGTSITFQSAVKNVGNVAASPASITRLKIDIGNDGTWDIPALDKTTSAPFLPEEEDGGPVYFWSNAWTATAGTHKVKVCADETSVIRESNEDNNCAQKTFTVSAAQSVAAAVASDTPLAATVPQGIDPGQNITKLRFVAPPGNAINITQIKITRIGMNTISSSDLSAITLRDFSVPAGVLNLVGSSIAELTDNTATFSLSPAWNIPPGQTKYLVMNTKTKADANIGDKFKLGIASAANIITDNGTTAAGTFPMYGNEFTIVAAPAAATVAIANPSGWTNSDEIKTAGDVDTTFGKFLLTAASTTNINPSMLTITKTGSLPDDRITGLKLITNNGTTIVLQKTALNIWKNVGGAPTQLPANTPADFELKGTIVRGGGPYDFTFSINQQPADGLNITSGVPFNLKHIRAVGTEDLPHATKLEPSNNSTIATLTPTLRWRAPDGIPPGTYPSFIYRWAIDDMTGGSFQSQVLKREFNWDGATSIGPASLPQKCPNNANIPGLENPWACTELTVPAGVLQYGHNYRWYVHMNNGEAHTPWCSTPHPYCDANIYFNFTTPPPPGLGVTAALPAGQNATIPAITNQTVKLFTLNFSMNGGDALTDRLKKIVLEYQNTSALEISKITDLHLFRGDSTEFTVGASAKDLISLNKNATNGTIEIVFQTAGPTTLLAADRNKHLTLYAKINASQGDNGKKIQYQVKSVEIEPAVASQMGLSIVTPEITVHEDPPNAPVATFEAAPASINKGQSTTLTWTVTGATTMGIDQGVGNIQGTGSRTVTPQTDTTYTLTATNTGGTITRTMAIAVAQPAAPPPPPPPAPAPAPPGQTCEQQGLHTYNGPPKPGERVNGMCIPCATQIYIANGGSCEVKKKKKSGKAVDRAFEPPEGIQQSSVALASGAAAGQRPAAAEPSPNLQGSQRLVRAPERANTGPETLVYIGILGAVHAGLWLRRRIKK